MEAVNCPVCGKPYRDDANFCNACGTPRPSDEGETPTQVMYPEHMRSCPSCHEPIDANLSFCTTCGIAVDQPSQSELLQQCPVCHKPLAPDESFCTSCGTALQCVDEAIPVDMTTELTEPPGEKAVCDCTCDAAPVTSEIKSIPEPSETAEETELKAEADECLAETEEMIEATPAGNAIISTPEALEVPFAPENEEAGIETPLPTTTETTSGVATTPPVSPPWRREAPGRIPVATTPKPDISYAPATPFEKHSTTSDKKGFPWLAIIIPVVVVALVFGAYFIFFVSANSKYQTQFENASSTSGWQFDAASSTSSYTANAGLTLNDGMFLYNQNYSDVRFTLTCTLSRAGADGYFCMWLRLNPSLHKGYCFIIKPETRTAHLGVAGDPNPISINILSLLPNYDPAQTHTYIAEAKSDYFSFSIDGVIISSFNDIGLTSGSVAMEAHHMSLIAGKAEIESLQ